jgi:predicted transposase/invertase (TIGR01784 family)
MKLHCESKQHRDSYLLYGIRGNYAYVNAYELRNGRTNKSFTDLIKLIILEIPKLPQAEEGGVWPWLKLFTCEKKEQYEELGRRHPEVNMAVSVLKELSLIGRIRMLADAREIQRRDNQAALEYELMEARERALREGHEQGSRQSRLEIARKMKNRGIPPDQIAEDTGLPPQEIAGL